MRFVSNRRVYSCCDTPCERAGPDGREQIRDEKLADARVVVAQVELLGIAQRLMRFVQKQMRGKIRVIICHCARRLAVAGLRHPGVAIRGGEIRAADGAVLVEQLARPKHAAAVVQPDRLFEIADGFVETVELGVMQSLVKPRRRVAAVEALRQPEVLLGPQRIAGFAPALGELAAEGGALRFHGGGQLQRLPGFLGPALFAQRERAAEPGVAQRAVERERLIEVGEGGGEVALP